VEYGIALPLILRASRALTPRPEPLESSSETA